MKPSPPRPQRQPVRVSPEAQAAAAVEVVAAAALAADLAALFADPQHPPDLEAGCVAAVHAPPGGGPGSPSAAPRQSLVRVDLSAVRGGSRRGLGARFLVAPATLAESLADAPGDDERVALLEALPEFRFKCRQAVQARALVDAVRQQRQGPQQGRQRQQQGRAAGGAAIGGGGKFVIPQRS